MIREPWGGSEELWFAMAKQAIAEGHEVMHVSFDFATIHPRLAELHRLGALLFQRPGFYPPGMSSKARAIRMLINYLKKKIRPPFKKLLNQRPDIIIYNGTAYSISHEKELLKALKNSNAKFYIISELIGEIDRGFDQADRAVILSAYDRAKKIFFLSRRMELTARRQLCREIPNAVLINNPVNMSEIAPLPFPSQDRANWAMVGNLLVVHKGQDLLLSALQAPKWKKRDWVLNIYGDGGDKDYLQMLTAFYGLQEKVIFHGRISGIRKVWEENQVLLMPSHMEGMSLAIVEAMLCGRPVMATDVGGAAEWIEDGNCGWLAPATVISMLDEAMERVWKDKEHWADMGIRAHRRAMELYDPVVGKTLLDELINP
ncbi:MAG TPA: glycosyltransferase family 4 protein [Puia sp.]